MSFRWRAALCHLGGSALMAGLAFLLVFLIWYPGELSQAAGVSAIVGLMLGVDLALGPALTALVSSPGKKRLWLDWAIIVAVQLLAFIYGMWTIAMARPAWVVFSGYRFDLVQATDIDTRFLSEAAPAYRSPPWDGPVWVSVRMPADLRKRNQLVMESVSGQTDMPVRPDLYAPMAQDRKRLADHARPLAELARLRGNASVDAIHQRWPEADGYFPMLARMRPMTVVVSRRNAAVLGLIDIKPFD